LPKQAVATQSHDLILASPIKVDVPNNASNLTPSTAPLSGLGSILNAQFDVKADRALTPFFHLFLQNLQAILA